MSDYERLARWVAETLARAPVLPVEVRHRIGAVLVEMIREKEVG